MKIKRIFMIFVTMMFCFLFSQYIVYAKPDPSINVNAKFNNKQKNFIAYTLLCIVIIFGILRNIEIFDYLKPTIIK